VLPLVWRPDDRGEGRGVTELFPSVCPCGHRGKSQYPDNYRCGACYYAARARGAREQAAQLQERAYKLLVQADSFDKRAESFRQRHPGAGSVLAEVRKKPGVWDKE